jgi:hypothetical protein
MGFFDWVRGKPPPESKAPPAEPVFFEKLSVSSKPGQKGLEFSNLESLMHMAESMEAVEHQRPKRPLLYLFQHVVLREAAFENQPELIGELAGAPGPRPLQHYRSKARRRCLQAGFLAADHMEDAAATAAEEQLFSAVKIYPHRRGGYTVFVITMPKPEAGPEAYFVAIVHKDNEPRRHLAASPATRYVTLEMADGSDLPLLGEWRENGTHATYGQGPPPEMGPFVEAVFNRFLAK